MADAAVTHVVPLGVSCRVTYQLRTYFRAGEAYPFDWWGSSIDGVARYLQDPDPDRIFSPDGLIEQTADGGIYTILSRTFGFQLFHEFPRRSAQTAIRVVSPQWRDHVAAARSAHERRLQRLLDLDRPGNAIVFVRHKLDAADDAQRIQENVDALWRTLSARWTIADIRLLLVNVPAFAPPCRRVLCVDFDDPPGSGPESWRGDDGRWAAAFASLGLAPRAGTLPLDASPSPGENA